MTAIKAAVVGVGHMGRHHARIYSEMPGVELTAVVDTNELAARDIAKKYNTQHFLDYHSLIGKVDAVSIATPTSFHYPISMALLNAGIHVLIEKPISSTVKEAKTLVQLAKMKNIILQVGHTERFNPAVMSLNGLVKNPIFIETHRMGPPTRRNLDVGVVFELMIHDIDIILNLVHSPIVKMQGFGLKIYSDHEDIAQAQILFENGCMASLSASRISSEKVRNLEITQEEGFLRLDYIEQNIILRKQVSSKYIFDQPKATYKSEFLLEQPLIRKDEPLRLEIEHFVECLREQKQPVVSGEDGKAALEIGNQILDSLILVKADDNQLTRELIAMSQ
ncbi:MAG: Gfo/Idh/MocA family oxidoreductase [Candidatus Eremiobacteraeota bacterium]|nr:Gfo/Idh/MocA family oxidoreductase [Candidatus Eremiobacteraeota bacterium]